MQKSGETLANMPKLEGVLKKLGINLGINNEGDIPELANITKKRTDEALGEQAGYSDLSLEEFVVLASNKKCAEWLPSGVLGYLNLNNGKISEVIIKCGDNLSFECFGFLDNRKLTPEATNKILERLKKQNSFDDITSVHKILVRSCFYFEEYYKRNSFFSSFEDVVSATLDNTDLKGTKIFGDDFNEEDFYPEDIQMQQAMKNLKKIHEEEKLDIAAFGWFLEPDPKTKKNKGYIDSVPDWVFDKFLKLDVKEQVSVIEAHPELFSNEEIVKKLSSEVLNSDIKNNNDQDTKTIFGLLVKQLEPESDLAKFIPESLLDKRNKEAALEFINKHIGIFRKYNNIMKIFTDKLGKDELFPSLFENESSDIFRTGNADCFTIKDIDNILKRKPEDQIGYIINNVANITIDHINKFAPEVIFNKKVCGELINKFQESGQEVSLKQCLFDIAMNIDVLKYLKGGKEKTKCLKEICKFISESDNSFVYSKTDNCNQYDKKLKLVCKFGKSLGDLAKFIEKNKKMPRHIKLAYASSDLCYENDKLLDEILKFSYILKCECVQNCVLYAFKKSDYERLMKILSIEHKGNPIIYMGKRIFESNHMKPMDWFDLNLDFALCEKDNESFDVKNSKGKTETKTIDKECVRSIRVLSDEQLEYIYDKCSEDFNQERIEKMIKAECINKIPLKVYENSKLDKNEWRDLYEKYKNEYEYKFVKIKNKLGTKLNTDTTGRNINFLDIDFGEENDEKKDVKKEEGNKLSKNGYKIEHKSSTMSNSILSEMNKYGAIPKDIKHASEEDLKLEPKTIANIMRELDDYSNDKKMININKTDADTFSKDIMESMIENKFSLLKNDVDDRKMDPRFFKKLIKCKARSFSQKQLITLICLASYDKDLIGSFGMPEINSLRATNFFETLVPANMLFRFLSCLGDKVFGYLIGRVTYVEDEQEDDSDRINELLEELHLGIGVTISDFSAKQINKFRDIFKDFLECDPKKLPKKLNELEKSDIDKMMILNLFVELSNSDSYVLDFLTKDNLNYLLKKYLDVFMSDDDFKSSLLSSMSVGSFKNIEPDTLECLHDKGLLADLITKEVWGENNDYFGSGLMCFSDDTFTKLIENYAENYKKELEEALKNTDLKIKSFSSKTIESLHKADLLSCILENNSITELNSEAFCTIFCKYDPNLKHLQSLLENNEIKKTAIGLFNKALLDKIISENLFEKIFSNAILLSYLPESSIDYLCCEKKDHMSEEIESLYHGTHFVERQIDEKERKNEKKEMKDKVSVWAKTLYDKDSCDNKQLLSEIKNAFKKILGSITADTVSGLCNKYESARNNSLGGIFVNTDYLFDSQNKKLIVREKTFVKLLNLDDDTCKHWIERFIHNKTIKELFVYFDETVIKKLAERRLLYEVLSSNHENSIFSYIDSDLFYDLLDSNANLFCVLWKSDKRPLSKVIEELDKVILDLVNELFGQESLKLEQLSKILSNNIKLLSKLNTNVQTNIFKLVLKNKNTSEACRKFLCNFSDSAKKGDRDLLSVLKNVEVVKLLLNSERMKCMLKEILSTIDSLSRIGEESISYLKEYKVSYFQSILSQRMKFGTLKAEECAWFIKDTWEKLFNKYSSDLLVYIPDSSAIPEKFRKRMSHDNPAYQQCLEKLRKSYENNKNNIVDIIECRWAKFLLCKHIDISHREKTYFSNFIINTAFNQIASSYTEHKDNIQKEDLILMLCRYSEYILGLYELYFRSDYYGRVGCSYKCISLDKAFDELGPEDIDDETREFLKFRLNNLYGYKYEYKKRPPFCEACIKYIKQLVGEEKTKEEKTEEKNKNNAVGIETNSNNLVNNPNEHKKLIQQNAIK